MKARQNAVGSLLAIMFIVTLMAAPTAAAWAQTGRIAGTVTAEDKGEPLSGATVEVLGPALKRKMGAVSRADGRYAVENIPAGTYTVRVTFSGYRGETVRGVAVAAGASVEVDFRLMVAPYELGEMVVSASRRAENVVDAPVSISKVDAKEVQRNTVASSYANMIKSVKGIDYTQIGIFQERFNTRGFNTALNTRLMLLIDGRISSWPSGAGGPLNPLGDPITKDDIQDVEIIAGPGSALYGSDAISGVVNITTKDPRDFQSTTFAITGGSRDMFKGRFYHTGLRNRWGWKVSGEYQRAHDFEVINRFFNADSSASVTDDPDFDAGGLRGGVGLFYYPDDKSKVGFVAGAVHSKGINFVNTGRLQADWAYQYQQVGYTSPGLYLNIYRTTDDTGDTYNLHTKAQTRLTGVPPDEAQQRAKFIGESSLWGSESRYNFDVPKLKNTHFNVGVNFRQHKPDVTVIEGKNAVSQVGFYGLSETNLSERFRVVLASRVDFHEVYGTQLSPKAALIFKPRPTAAFRATFNRAFRSPTILEQRIGWRVSPTTVARGNGKGFRFGSVTGDPLPPQFVDGIPQLKPQENTTFELGFKGVFAKKVFLDVSGYRSWYKDFISPLRPIGDSGRGIVILDENGNPRKGERTLTYLNFGKQKVFGFDLGVDMYVTDRVLVKGNISFIEAGKLEASGGIDEPFNTPRTIFNLGLSTSDVFAKGAALDLSLRHVSEFDFRSGVHVGRVPAYTVVDLHLGYRTKYGVTYRLSATNVFDNEHIEMIDGAEIGRIVVGEIQYAF